MLALQYLVPESDIEGFRIPRDAVTSSYEMVSAGTGPQDKEFRLSSEPSMPSIITSLEGMLGRACTGMMTNTTLLGLLKVRQSGQFLSPMQLIASLLYGPMHA